MKTLPIIMFQNWSSKVKAWTFYEPFFLFQTFVFVSGKKCKQNLLLGSERYYDLISRKFSFFHLTFPSKMSPTVGYFSSLRMQQLKLASLISYFEKEKISKIKKLKGSLEIKRTKIWEALAYILNVDRDHFDRNVTCRIHFKWKTKIKHCWPNL